jgi:tyrosyl-tRNA synthetase
MGKTASGAVWLDPERTSPYDYYQFWINTDDNDVARFLALFTFLPIAEIDEVKKLDGADLNCAKSILAYEATKICHGIEEAQKAMQSAAVNFGERIIPDMILPSSEILRGQVNVSGDSDTTPQSIIKVSAIESGIPAFKLFHETALAQSGSAARRLIAQGGAYLNGNRIESVDYIVGFNDIENDEILLKAGKKKIHKIKIKL